MDDVDDVALMQIAVLQQNLLERDVEEASKRKKDEKTEKILDPSMAGTGRGEEEAACTLHQTAWRGSESKTHNSSSTTSGWSLPCLTNWYTVQRVGPSIEKQDTSVRKALRFPLE